MLKRDLQDARCENARLQEKLCKAKNLMVFMQKQADDARAERDRERMKAESLHKSSQQLMRQLKREAAKVQALERRLLAVPRGGDAGGRPAAAEPCAHDASAQDVDVDRSFVVTSAPGSSSAPAAAASPGQCSVPGPEHRASCLEAAEAAPGGAYAGGALSAAEEAGPEQQKSWEFVVQGQQDAAGAQPDFAPKVISCFPDDAVQRASSRGVVCVCTRGRRLDSGVPNQDDFVAARHSLVHGGHIALYGVFDGHGPAGHRCAAFARGALPESLFGQRTLLLKPEDTLREAFRQTHENLLGQAFDTVHSGTTATLALVLSLPAAADAPDGARAGEAWLFVAHVGDSRAILASHRSAGDPSAAFTVTALTRDHRPDDAEEAERIQNNGGEIRRLRETSGAVRVFARGHDRPALALTRSLGASGATGCGVIAEPEVSAYRLRPGVDVLLLLGTDGLFEFCSNSGVAGQLLRDGLSASSLETVCGSSREMWSKSSYNETVDDITAIAAALPSEA